MQVQGPVTCFPRSYVIVGAEETAERQKDFGYDLVQEDATERDAQKLKAATATALALANSTASFLEVPEEEGKVYLHTLAKIIRSKNAGPFEITFDDLQ
jgi:hypothetical protein